MSDQSVTEKKPLPVITSQDAHNILVFIERALAHEPIGSVNAALAAVLLSQKLQSIKEADDGTLPPAD